MRTFSRFMILKLYFFLHFYAVFYVRIYLIINKFVFISIFFIRNILLNTLNSEWKECGHYFFLNKYK